VLFGSLKKGALNALLLGQAFFIAVQFLRLGVLRKELSGIQVVGSYGEVARGRAPASRGFCHDLSRCVYLHLSGLLRRAFRGYAA
jgi:hypothetical protein